MIIDKRLADEIDKAVLPNAADPACYAYKRYGAEGLDIRLLRNPKPLSATSIVSIEYALVALFNGEYIYSVAVEHEDLRDLAAYLGESVKNLQNDYGTKGFFTPSHIVAYGDGRKEDLGLITAKDESAIFQILSDTLLDSLDIIEELKEVNE